jgi:hypothetical protein
MNVGTKTAILLGAALAVWPGCASRQSNLERPSAAAAAPAPKLTAAAAPNNPSAAQTASDVENVRSFLCGRAREQLALLASEMVRIAHRLEHEGTDEQREEWAPVLSSMEQDRVLLAAGLLEAERAPLEGWAEVHAILPSVIDVFMIYGAQAMTDIEQELDALAAPASTSSARPRGI